MNLFLLGASHHSAPVDLRERIDFTRRGVSDALSEIAQVPGLTEVVTPVDLQSIRDLHGL